ncbi:hypothetical protein ACYFX5_26880 [Bremerella sp. T1]|uniref:hypothetical protein n=1 Tax=Bremerella sp. TYQ1 TaxID=3119568 RepID=UPI001CCFAABB|nr:hypothetical protein [Bremerella volcania]UBM36635.1 hypothetical protein LA756_01735 [Bremerella volcania]
MSSDSNRPHKPTFEEKFETGVAFALGAAVVTGALTLIATGGNVPVAIAVATKTGAAAGLGGGAGS